MLKNCKVVWLIKQKENESYLSYIKRIAELKRDGKISYEELGNYILRSDDVYSSDNIRKFWYVFDKIIDKINDDFTVTDNDRLIEIKKQKDELYKERIKLRDKKRELNKKLYEESRFDNLKEILIEKLSVLSPTEIIKKIEYIPRSDLQASLLISDLHYGIIIDNQFNYYDTDVCVERLNQLVSKTIYYCKLHKVNTLNVELLGDLVSGIINISGRCEQEEDIITQVISISEILSNMIKTLANEIPEVKVYCVFGNHSRTNPNKKDSINRENFERLIFHYIKTKLPDIKVITSLNDDFLLIKIDGKNIVLNHGDKDNPTNAILNYTRLLNIKPDEVHSGHLHSFSIKDDCDSEVIVNGSVCGSDDYAVQIRRSTKPSQVLRIYDNDTCTYKITLD